jgi:predicted TIM-barrel fold metal-dependent hydrolase
MAVPDIGLITCIPYYQDIVISDTKMNAIASPISYPAFDADNHYYEAIDAFTRHLPHAMKRRCVQWATIDGRQHHIVGGKVAAAVTNPTWNPISLPGSIAPYLHGHELTEADIARMQAHEPLPDYYLSNTARVAKLEEQGLEAIWLFPTLGVLYEELLRHDTEAVKTQFTAFNRWLDEDWGCNFQNKIFAAPYISLCDVDWACQELEWAIERGASVVCMRPSAVTLADGSSLSPADSLFDPFWARLNEAGITLVIHASDSGYTTQGYVKDGFSVDFSGGVFSPSIKHFNIERAAYDFLITLAYEKLFERFPNLRIASVENGAEFLPDLFRKLAQSRDRMRGYYSEDPGELFKRHVWINPFWEDDVNEVAHYMGTDRVIFGSDWPHIEGLPTPLDYVGELDKFDDGQKQQIMRDNARFLNTPRPA